MRLPSTCAGIETQMEYALAVTRGVRRRWGSVRGLTRAKWKQFLAKLPCFKYCHQCRQTGRIESSLLSAEKSGRTRGEIAPHILRLAQERKLNWEPQLAGRGVNWSTNGGNFQAKHGDGANWTALFVDGRRRGHLWRHPTRQPLVWNSTFQHF